MNFSSFVNFLPGHYMYIEGTGVHAWNSAHLISPTPGPAEDLLPQVLLPHVRQRTPWQLNVRVLDEARPEQPGDVVWTMLWGAGQQVAQRQRRCAVREWLQGVEELPQVIYISLIPRVGSRGSILTSKICIRLSSSFVLSKKIE